MKETKHGISVDDLIEIQNNINKEKGFGFPPTAYDSDIYDYWKHLKEKGLTRRKQFVEVIEWAAGKDAEFRERYHYLQLCGAPYISLTRAESQHRWLPTICGKKYLYLYIGIVHKTK